MGRCYDFGISIDPSSEKAMVVSPEGGYCVSPSTGVTCEGRFDGCDEIVAIPGRVPSSAPGWSLPTNGSAPSTQDTGTSALPLGSTGDSDEQRASTEPPDDRLDQLTTIVKALAQQIAETTKVDASKVDASTQTDDLVRQIAQAAEEDRALGRARDQALSELTNSIKSLRHDLAEMADNRPTTSIDDIVEEMVILREELAPSPIPAELADSVDKTMEELAELRGPVETIGRAMLELKSSQEQTTYAVAALRDRLKGPLAMLERRCQTDMTGPDLAAKLSELCSEIGRIQPESAQNTTAGQLADTINALRDAGVEDISAAHLIHSLQVEMRTLRDEVVGIRGDIAEFATNAGNLERA